MDIWRKNILGKGKSKYKSLRFQHGWCSSKEAMAGWIKGGGDVGDESESQRGNASQIVSLLAFALNKVESQMQKKDMMEFT